MRLYILVAITMLVVLSCSKNTYNVYKVEDKTLFSEKQGMFYYLPRTVLSLDVKLEKTSKIKGPYAAYAGKYLGLTNVIAENSATYSIISIQMNSYSEPDPNKLFFVELPEKMKKNIKLSFSENGSLLCLNCSINETGIGNNKINYNNTIENQSSTFQDPFLMFLNNNIMEKADTIFETIHMDTVKVQKQVIKRTFIEKTTEQKANETASYILKLNEQKYALITGYQEVAYTNNTLEFMCNSIDKQIAEYMSLFTGKTLSDTLSYHFIFIPAETNKAEKIFAFSFDRKNGINRAPAQEKLSNYFIEMTTSNATQKIQDIILEQNKKPITQHGLYYNIPELSSVKLLNSKGESIFETQFFIAQFGKIFNLPASSMKAVFYGNMTNISEVETR